MNDAETDHRDKERSGEEFEEQGQRRNQDQRSVVSDGKPRPRNRSDPEPRREEEPEPLTAHRFEMSGVIPGLFPLRPSVRPTQLRVRHRLIMAAASYRTA